MIPYRVLRSRFHPNKVSDEMLTMALSSVAVLVRGNFALKSTLAKFLHAAGGGDDLLQNDEEWLEYKKEKDYSGLKIEKLKVTEPDDDDDGEDDESDTNEDGEKVSKVLIINFK